MSSGGPGSRRQAREAALQVLFASEANGPIEVGVTEVAFRAVVDEFDLPTRARARAEYLVSEIAANCKEIDECIERTSRNWRLGRLASVERNVLRIGVYELLFDPETPAAVVIDEAVEVTRRFAGEGSPSFVNGVLDAISKGRNT